jgi:hypothetical protein
MFGSFEVHAGDFKAGPGHQYLNGQILMRKEGSWLREKIPLARVQEIEVASEESVKKMAGAVGWGLAGAFVLGPVGLLAGVLAGGNRRNVTFICRLADGRAFMATAPHAVYQKFTAATFGRQGQRGPSAVEEKSFERVEGAASDALHLGPQRTKRPMFLLRALGYTVLAIVVILVLRAFA